MTTHRDPKTGRFDIPASDLEPVDHQHERIVQRFVEAARPPRQRAYRWTWPFGLAVAVVAGLLAGAAYEYGATQPQILDLQANLKQKSTLIHEAHQAFDSLFKADDRLEKAAQDIKHQNDALTQHYDEVVVLYGQRQAAEKAAGHDVQEAADVLQHAQNEDTLNNREQAAMVIKALQRAEKRLKAP